VHAGGGGEQGVGRTQYAGTLPMSAGGTAVSALVYRRTTKPLASSTSSVTVSLAAAFSQ
jgi:hypothetical protein